MKRILLLTFYASHFSLAQENELAAQLLYEIPQGEFGTIYSPAPLMQLSYSKMSKYKKKWNSIGGNLGYMAMKPQRDAFEYFVSIDNVVSSGKATYSTYKSYQLMGNIKWGRELSQLFDVFWGCDIGLNYTIYSYSLKSAVSVEDGTIVLPRVAFAPKLGLSIGFNKSLHWDTQMRYVFSIGDSETGILNRYISVGTGLSYLF